MTLDLWQRCEMCGQRATATCSKCRASHYCGQACQRRSWVGPSVTQKRWGPSRCSCEVGDHKPRCRFAGGLLAARRQLQSQDFALALLTAEEVMKAHAGALKREAEKDLAFDADVVQALLRGFATAMVEMAEALAADKDLAQYKFCRACFSAVATMLDLAAALQDRCPAALWKQVQAIVGGLGPEVTRKQGDPILSAWMMYDSYAKGLADRPTVYESKVPRMKIVALIALRDALAASAALLEDSKTFADAYVAKSIDVILETGHLKVCRDDLAVLREFYPKGAGGLVPGDDEEDDTIEPWHKF